MPIQFVNSAAEAFFWVFFVLTLIATAVHLTLCFKKACLLRLCICPLPMFFFALACVCLAPQDYLVYTSCFLLAAGIFCFDLKARFEGKAKTAVYLIAMAITGAAHFIVFSECVGLLSYSVPVYAYFLIAVGFLLIGGGYRLLRRHAPVPACIEAAADCIPLLDFIFALMLVIDMPLYATVFLLLGCAFSFSGEIVHRFKSPRREFNAYVCRYLGAIILHLGLILSVAAEHGLL